MTPPIATPCQCAGSEGLHGIRCGHGVDCGRNGSTVFPQTIGHAAAFNRTLWRAVGDAISTEFRAFSNQGHGFLSVFAPNINIFRESRWGRGANRIYNTNACWSFQANLTAAATCRCFARIMRCFMLPHVGQEVRANPVRYVGVSGWPLL